ncbi:MAG: CynX/NimT family MFS transporter [Saccharofermentanales bacterium]
MAESKTLEPTLKRHVHPIAMMVVMTIATAAISFCMFKFPPIMKYVMMSYEVDTGLMGLLMSSTNIIGFVFAVAIGYINRSYKPKWTGLIGFLIMALANVIAASTTNFIVLIISRVIEGAGMGILSNLTIALVVAYFKGARATATAIVNAGMTAGQVIHYNLSVRLAEKSGNLSGMYTYIIITFVVMAVVMLVFLWREPSLAAFTPTTEKSADMVEAEKLKKGEVLKNRSLWLIAAGMFIFNIVMISFNNYVPTFLQDAKGLDSVSAASLTSVASTIRTFVMIALGILADRIASKRKPAIASFVGICIMYLLLAWLPGNLIMVYIILSAIAPASVTVSTYSCYPDIFGDASYTPVAHGVVQTTARLAMLIGSALVGYLIKFLGYTGTIYVIAPLALVAAVCWFFAKEVK